MSGVVRWSFGFAKHLSPSLPPDVGQTSSATWTRLVVCSTTVAKPRTACVLGLQKTLLPMLIAVSSPSGRLVSSRGRRVVDSSALRCVHAVSRAHYIDASHVGLMVIIRT
ncbi:hypothetical protein SPRG_19220 [Saprolegnia parasitica CBS 223.65]|uniref:Uncharacterized protein n=1 Tax=Saprolegnia parasitica (strain CBS 223.65) TaxID=695850 RepID=A0A067CSU2_SAPPC|nr:hypothetical protein SPRG_19220 [Saprolegnia parasitica CBS 223.65]KDO33588.1 hypothetical protein SPRG_19220 [Saprolegnia parasitica CBS 223.65]|eukprot:XP_012195640.1 hypothetical protein SPRG_19220 [Saprolegnia parasitica CBS 223.65]